MNETGMPGKVSQLWRFPVKSMRGEQLETATIGEAGLAGDRAYALLDIELDKLVSAKSLKRFPDIFAYRASYAREPNSNEPLPPVNVEIPNGNVISSEAGDFDEVLSTSLGQQVKLVRVGARGTIPFHDAASLSVLTEATLERLRALQPESDFDVRRFRMNIIVEASAEGFVENDWVGREIQVGNEVCLHVTETNARCVMTTLAQDELPVDREIFAAMVKHNRLEKEGGRPAPCAGVYTRVISGGEIGVGDAIC